MRDCRDLRTDTRLPPTMGQFAACCGPSVQDIFAMRKKGQG